MFAPNAKSMATGKSVAYGLLNFRDVGISTENPVTKEKYIKQGMIFRSATLDNMTKDDIEGFIKEHGIRTILDLRTGLEAVEGLPIDKSFPTMALENVKTSDLLGDPKDSGVHSAEATQTTECLGTLRKKFRVDFAGKNFQRYCVFMSCSLRLKITLVVLMLFCQKKKASYLVGRDVLGPMGVSKMYRKFAIYCQSEVRQALEIFTDPSNYPIHIHCTQGKDRTGIVACLLEYIAGVPTDVIIKDYAKTQEGLEPVRDMMLTEIRKAGLTEDFANAPPKASIQIVCSGGGGGGGGGC
ncbi:protein-tyrosine phosphatase-like protein [Phycomyces nitens]|nr:protein-tyrosine phosphatase-like protein [Phycomyces nitens]